MASTFTKLLYHIVYSTKHREPLIVPSLRDDLYDYIGGIIRGEGGVLIEIGGIADHVHIVARFRTEPSVAQMIKTIKAQSSKWVNERPGRVDRFSWQIGYGAFTVATAEAHPLRSESGGTPSNGDLLGGIHLVIEETQDRIRRAVPVGLIDATLRPSGALAVQGSQT